MSELQTLAAQLVNRLSDVDDLGFADEVDRLVYDVLDIAADDALDLIETSFDGRVEEWLFDVIVESAATLRLRLALAEAA